MTLIVVLAALILVNFSWSAYNWYRIYIRKQAANSGPSQELNESSIIEFIAKVRTAIDKLQKEQIEIEDDVNQLKLKAESAEDDNEKNDLEAQINTSEEKLEKINSDFDLKKQIFEKIGAQFNGLEDDFDSDLDLEPMPTDLDDAPMPESDDGEESAELSNLREMIEHLEAEKSDMRLELSSKEDEIAQLMQSLEELAEGLPESPADGQNEGEGSEDSGDLEAEINALKEQLEELKNENIGLKAEVDSIAIEDSDSSESSGSEDIEKLRTEFGEELQKKNEELKALETELENNRSIISGMGDGNEHDPWMNWIQEFMKDFSYEQDISKDPAGAKEFLRGQIRELKAYESDLSELQQNYTELEEAYEEAMTQEVNPEIDYHAIQEKEESLRKQLIELHEKFEAVTAENEQLKLDQETNNNLEIRELKSRMAELEKELIDANTELVEIMEQNIALKAAGPSSSEEASSEEAATAASGDTSEMQQKMNQLEQELDYISSEYEKLFENSLDQAEVDNQMKSLKEENEQLKSRVSSLQNELDTTVNDLDQLTQEYEKLFMEQMNAGNVSNLDKEVFTKLKEKNDRLEKALLKIKDDYVHVLKELQRLKS